jgi:hypothetical protein
MKDIDSRWSLGSTRVNGAVKLSMDVVALVPMEGMSKAVGGV